jgi:hypothetical protein
MKQSIQSKEEYKEEKKSEKTCPHCLEVRRVRNKIELNVLLSTLLPRHVVICFVGSASVSVF